MHAGSAGQIARRAVLGRHGEHVAAGAEQGALAIRRNFVIGDVLADFFQHRPSGDEILGQHDGHFLRLLRGQVEAVNVAAIFVHDGIHAQRWKFDIEFAVVGELAGFLAGEIVHVEVHAFIFIAVGEKINLVAVPHGDDVLRRVVGDVFDLLGCEIENPHVVGHAAAVAFPGAEFAEDAIVGHFFIVG